MSGLSPTAAIIKSALNKPVEDTLPDVQPDGLCYQNRPRRELNQTTHEPSTLCFRALKNKASDDLLCSVLQFLPFESALAICQGLRFDLEVLSRLPLWRTLFHRTRFCMDCCCDDEVDYLQQLHQRHRWLRTLCYGSTPVPARWPRSLAPSILLTPNAHIVLRRDLVYSTNYLRRNRQRHRQCLFQFQCSSPADTLRILVLERDNEGSIYLSEQSILPVDRDVGVRDAPQTLLAETATSAETTAIHMLHCRHTATESSVVLVTTTTTTTRNDTEQDHSSETTTTATRLDLWQRSRATQGRWAQRPSPWMMLPPGTSMSWIDYAANVVVTAHDNDTNVLVHYQVREMTTGETTSPRSVRLPVTDPIQAMHLVVVSAHEKETALFLRIITLHPTQPWLQGCFLHLYDLSSFLPSSQSQHPRPQWLESKAMFDGGDDENRSRTKMDELLPLCPRNNNNVLSYLRRMSFTPQRQRPDCSTLATADMDERKPSWWASLHNLRVAHKDHVVFVWKEDSSLLAMINLPLLLTPTPQLHVIGNRLLVLGKDHISLILLVYRIDLQCRETTTAETTRSLHLSRSSPRHAAGERSGGVVCSEDDPTAVQFVNRRRPEGDCPDDGSLQLTCNERIVLVQVLTDEGKDGVWVLDLEGPGDDEEESDVDDHFEILSTSLIEEN